MSKHIEQKTFTDSFHCTSRVHCEACRNLEGGRKFREIMAQHLTVPGGKIDFICPYNVPWGFKKDSAQLSIVEKRHLPTPSQVKTFVKAVTTGERVSPEIAKERIETCRTCQFRRVTPEGLEFCGVCGCKVSANDREITNLAAYVENLPHYGCKAPNRKNGNGWKR